MCSCARIEHTTAVEVKVTLLRVRALVVLIYSTASKQEFPKHPAETGSRQQDNAGQQSKAAHVLERWACLGASCTRALFVR